MNIDIVKIDQAISKAQKYLLERQHSDGYWQGRLEADASVTAGYVPLMYQLAGEENTSRMYKAVREVLSKQNPSGSWSTYPGGPGDISVSVQCYFSLKIAGIAPEEDCMRAARHYILTSGGLERANLFTKIWLALFGQYDWNKIPRLPPEIIFLPKWFPINIYEFASWSRATIMALCVLQTLKPVFPLPERAYVLELYAKTADDLLGRRHDPEIEYHTEQTSNELKSNNNWQRSLYLQADRLFQQYEKFPWQPGRHLALKQVEKWLIEHQEADGSWGGILLPWIYSLFALRALGYSHEHTAIKRGVAGLESFLIEDKETLLFQPATSPVWDTAWTILALRESGLPANHPALQRAAEWLLKKEIQRAGDWRIKNPTTNPGGWSFEFTNEWYPDLDDSSVVPRALAAVQLQEPLEAQKHHAIQRAASWVMEMQSSDGGWAAFDRDNNRQFLDHIPFADFMSPLDPTCADVTAHVLEFLSSLKDGMDNPHLRKKIDQGIDYLKKSQESDGAWYGRWGVNYLYGTALTLAGLMTAGLDCDDDSLEQGIAWLLEKQNANGGWGESCLTYVDPTARGHGETTASQTAWALIGLLSVPSNNNLDDRRREPIFRGVNYLLDTQEPEGDWREDLFTGGGFPGLFYLRYDLYRVYFPLLALAKTVSSISYPSNLRNPELYRRHYE